MTTLSPYTEGRLAGYRNAPSDNPYRRGIDVLYTADMIVWAQQWDDGYLEGQAQGHDDILARRLEACR